MLNLFLTKKEERISLQQLYEEHCEMGRKGGGIVYLPATKWSSLDDFGQSDFQQKGFTYDEGTGCICKVKKKVEIQNDVHKLMANPVKLQRPAAQPVSLPSFSTQSNAKKPVLPLKRLSKK